MTHEPGNDTAAVEDETSAVPNDGSAPPPADAIPGRQPGVPVVATALLVVLALLVGSVGGAWLARRAPGDDSAEAGFARDMSTHHAQAVSMGATVHATTTDPQIRILALDIVLTQQAQIGMMQAWLDRWGLSPTGQDPPMTWMADGGHHGHGDAAEGVDPHTGLMPGMATPAQLAELRRLRGTAQDILFCQLMIVHHRAGITMAEAVLTRTDDRRVRELARSMQNGQASEIGALTGQLRRLGGTAPR